MTTEYYTASGQPGSHSAGQSNTVRSEFSSIESGFAKLPGLAGNAGKLVAINAGGTAMDVLASAPTAVGLSLLTAADEAAGRSAILAAPLADPVFTGNPRAPTPTPGDNDTSIATTAFTNTAIAGAPTSFKNKLINSNFSVNQRAYVSGAATSGANQPTLDRWRVVTSGQNLAYTSYKNGRTVTAPAGGVEQIIFGEDIEGGVYTLSWTGTATATVNGSAITNGGQTSSLTAATDITVKFSGGTVSECQFERGSSRTAYECHSFGYEQDQCRRDYENSYAYGVVPGSAPGAYAGELVQIALNGGDFYSGFLMVPFKKSKRSAPEMTYYNPVSGAANFQNYSTGLADNTVGTRILHENGFSVYGVDGTMTPNNIYAVHWAASTGY